MNFTPDSNVAIPLRQVCTDFDFKDKHKIRTLVTILESTAQILAQSGDFRSVSLPFPHSLQISERYRRQAGEDLKLWTDLRKLWRDLARTQLSFWDNDDSSDEEDGEGEEEREGADPENDALRAVCAKLAKFTRNLVAEVPANQLRA